MACQLTMTLPANGLTKSLELPRLQPHQITWPIWLGHWTKDQKVRTSVPSGGCV